MPKQPTPDPQTKTALEFTYHKLNHKIHQSIALQRELAGITSRRSYKIYTALMVPLRLAKQALSKLFSLVLALARIIILRSAFLTKLSSRHARQIKRLMSFSSSFAFRFYSVGMQKKRATQYQAWVTNHWPSPAQLKRQANAATNFKYQPTISLLMPTYNTDPNFLRAAVESVRNQSYPKWQLCIADDASTKPEVKQLIAELAQLDRRIVYKLRERNGHICAASNTALELAKGEYIGLLDHDDVLWPNALYEVARALNKNRQLDLIYSDEDKLTEDGTGHEDPFFKPDWSPDYLRCINYITHFTVIRRAVVSKVGGFRKGVEGAQDWDLILRASRQSQSANIHHIPTILYSWRKTRDSTALRADAKDYAWLNQQKVLDDDITARKVSAKAINSGIPGFWKIMYEVKKLPLISIIIPTKNQYEILKKCLESIYEQTTYPNYEIILIDTGSTDSRLKKLYQQEARRQNLRLKQWDKAFNFAAVCNYGAAEAAGEYFLFLNNDTEVAAPNWLEHLLADAQRPEIGAVGCKLLYPDQTIQHAGIVLGMGGDRDTPGVAGHVFSKWPDNIPEMYKSLLTDTVRNWSAVTAACMMVEKAKFEAVGGFDESLIIAFNDVDFCLNLGKAGYYNLYNPHVILYHHESISVGKLGGKRRSYQAFRAESLKMGKRWGWQLLHNDPFYNPNYYPRRAYAEINPDAQPLK